MYDGWTIFGLVLTYSLLLGVTFAYALRKADNDDLDYPTAVALLVFVLFAATFIQAVALTEWLGVVFVFLVLGGIVLPWLGSIYTRDLHLDLDERFIDMCRAAAHFDPHNAGAHAQLAEVSAQQQLYEEAVLHYEMALTLAPDPELNTQYDKWIRRLEAARRDQKKRDTFWYQRTQGLRRRL